MSTSTIVVPDDFAWVAASLLSTTVLLIWQSQMVARWRNIAEIKFPQTYADAAAQSKSKDALIFNCTQRAHQNTLECIPIIYTLALLCSLKYPHCAAAGCGLWCLGRVSNTIGYMSGKPAKRQNGAFGNMGLLCTLLGALKVVYDMFVDHV